jgi:hypothetical protein
VKSPCGTYSAYQRHVRTGETPCEPCRAAAAVKQREYRQNNPDAYRRELDSRAARDRALERLAREYPHRFAELVADERRPLYAPEPTP